MPEALDFVPELELLALEPRQGFRIGSGPSILGEDALVQRAMACFERFDPTLQVQEDAPVVRNAGEPTQQPRRSPAVRHGGATADGLTR